MPELPEVETISRGLDAQVRGRRIEAVELFWPRAVDPASLPIEALVGDRIDAVGRTGKFVVFKLASGRTLAVHLRMTGRLVFAEGPSALAYARASFRLDGGAVLVFTDVRKFGRMRLLVGDARQVLGVGADPLDGELDEPALRRLLRGRTTPIKTWLLDQRRVAGIGNIYASEALHYAGIRPKKRAGTLTAAQRKSLIAALHTVLRKAIRHRGSSVDDYVDAEGKQGAFQKLLAVYGRAGQPCRRCRTPIRRIVLAQRATFFCPTCQQ